MFGPLSRLCELKGSSSVLAQHTTPHSRGKTGASLHLSGLLDARAQARIRLRNFPQFTTLSGQHAIACAIGPLLSHAFTGCRDNLHRST